MPSLYDMSIPIFTRALENMLAFLKVGEKWAEDNNIPKEKLLDGKLADDMKTLPFQIQSACNTAKFTPVRLGGVEDLVIEDKETTFPELFDRLEKTIEFLKKAKPEAFEGKDDAEVVLKGGAGEFKFTSVSYLQKFAIPNFFFHEMVAYSILRKVGVPVGKFDFLGKTL